MRTISFLAAASALTLVPGLLLAEGGTGAAFLNLDAGADAVAVGGAAVWRQGSAGTVFCNPGGLGWLRGAEFIASHSEHIQSTRCEFLTAAYGSRRLALAVSLQGFSLSGLEERTGPSAAPLSTFGATALYFQSQYARAT